jgi:hypothetical protein
LQIILRIIMDQSSQNLKNGNQNAYPITGAMVPYTPPALIMEQTPVDSKTQPTLIEELMAKADTEPQEIDQENATVVTGKVIETDHYIEQATKRLVEGINYLKNNILQEKDPYIAGKKEKIIFDMLIFLKKRSANVYSDSDGDDDDDDDDLSVVFGGSSDDDNDTSSDTSQESYYQETESEYVFKTDPNLKREMNKLMSESIDKLETKDNFEYMKLKKIIIV